MLPLLLATLLVSIAPGTISLSAQTPCDYYASPNGGGDGLTNSRPFRIQDFWATAAPGKTLCLLDGVYQGAANMIVPPTGQSGTSGAPITVRALNDGGVFIDGQFAQMPFRTAGNNWWTFQGFDAGNSSAGVYRNDSPSTNLVLRRICLANGRYTVPNTVNEHVFAPNYATNGIFEDLCIFGTNRTPMTEYTEGGAAQNNTYRRLWLRYEGAPPSSDGGGGFCAATPTLQYAYNGVGPVLYENIITVHAPEQYNLATWGSWLSCGIGVPYKPAIGRRDPSPGLYRMLGFISYGYAGFTSVGQTAMRGGDSWMDDYKGVTQFRDYFLDARSQQNGSAFVLACPSCGSSSADRLTSIQRTGGAASTFSTFGSRTPTNANECFTSPSATGASLGGCPSFYTGDTPGTGARNCFEYQDGTLTTIPLWPWRMDDRIKAALARARAQGTGGSALAGVAGTGYAANTVTSEIVSRYGAIPTQCRSLSAPEPSPPTSTQLR